MINLYLFAAITNTEEVTTKVFDPMTSTSDNTDQEETEVFHTGDEVPAVEEESLTWNHGSIAGKLTFKCVWHKCISCTCMDVSFM
jgi:hypothetical protein